MNVIRANRKLVVAGTVLLALALLLTVRGVVTARTTSDEYTLKGQPTFEVRQGPLTISATVSGTIKAREQEVIKCEVEGQTTILSIVPEGERVKKGDLLLELDSSQLQDSLVDQEIRVQNAEASYVSSKEQLEVTRNQAQSDVDKAELAYRFAEEDLKNFIEGEFPKQKKEAEARITLSEGTLKRVEEKLIHSERLAQKNFITQNELEAARQDAVKARLDLELARDEMKLLTDFTYTRQLAQLESDVRQAQMALERTQRKAAADVVQADADLKAKESEYLRQKGKLDKLNEQLVKTKVYAPMDGLVVYATSGQGSWRGNAEPLREGQNVRERQELIHLPTGSTFTAAVDLHESSLNKVRPGLPAIVKVDALPGRQFQGRVVSVAPLPDAQSVWLNPDLKVYSTNIDIEGEVDGLRTGMSCQAEIIVDRYPEAIFVPVQAVVRVGGKPTVFIPTSRGSEAREVELGLDNNNMVRILAGLKPGERVLLAPPLHVDDSHRDEETAEEELAAEGATVAVPASAESAPGAPSGERGGEAAPGAPGERPRGQRSGEGAGGAPEGRRGVGGFENLSEEQRRQLREQFQNMSPEERERLRQQFGGGRPGGGRPRGEEGQ